MRVEDGFQQTPCEEGNAYTTDLVLPALLKRILPPSFFEEINSDLLSFGSRLEQGSVFSIAFSVLAWRPETLEEIRPLGSRVGPPQLTQYDQWGRRVDILQTSEGWRNLKAVSQREGIPGIFYERKYGEYSRPYGFSRALLMVGDGHEVFCPMSMTDGAARIIELLGTPAMKSDVFPRLISRDPSVAFVAGQWMTERPGGSDISQTETVARPTGTTHKLGQRFSLDGFKWFSSATDSQIAVALARTGTLEEGSRGLSLFLIPLRLPLFPDASVPAPAATSNNIFVHRLKNKIGTHTLPTAELSLQGSEAYLIGQLGDGVKNIAPVLNITRVWSAVASVGALRKCLSIATSYAKVRKIESGRRLLQDSPLHVSQLASISLVYRALTHLTFGVIQLLGKVECRRASPEDVRRLRMLTPVVKAFAAEKASGAMEDAMSALGGAGYMEENEMGRLIRDALVEKIWEGTTTVLSLDLVRSTKDPLTTLEFISWAKSTIAASPVQLRESFSILNKALETLASALHHPIAVLVPRPALFLTGYIASSIFLLEQMIWSSKNSESTATLDLEVFSRWTLEGGILDAVRAVENASEDRVKINSAIVFGKL